MWLTSYFVVLSPNSVTRIEQSKWSGSQHPATERDAGLLQSSKPESSSGTNKYI